MGEEPGTPAFILLLECTICQEKYMISVVEYIYYKVIKAHFRRYFTEISNNH